MAILEIRQRTGWLFVAVVVAHIVLISTQAKSGKGVTLLDTVIFGAFAEVQRTTSTGLSAVTETWQNYFALQQIRQENDSLKQRVAELQIAVQRETELAEQARTLQALLELKKQLPFATTGARVIGGSASTEFRTITIDKGSQDGLRADMAVISPTGVVGRIIQPSSRASKVQLLIDTDAAAGALVERSRAQGIVIGTKSGLRLEYVPSSADIKVGDKVVTSGIEGIFPAPPSIDGKYPKGFEIGQIESMKRGAGQFENVVVRPAVDFTSLESVLIVMTPPVGEAPVERAGTPAAGRNGRR